MRARSAGSGVHGAGCVRDTMGGGYLLTALMDVTQLLLTVREVQHLNERH